MRDGILWYDNNPNTTLEEKIQKAVDFYKKRHGTLPNLCLVHASTIQKATKIGDITILPYLPVLPGHFWIGVEDSNATQSSWYSCTGHFKTEEIKSFQDTWENHFDKLVDQLLACNPISCLRAIVEIMFNSGYAYPESKFGELLRHQELSKHWSDFLIDPTVDNFDRGYAVTLLNEMLYLSPELTEEQATRLSQKLK